MPINGRSFQSMLTLTPGVAQPNYFQTGGINNPARSMQVSVNGAPNSNTVFRLDGVSATNQWIQGLQAYTPAIEAIETVNVVTNSFDAEQGMAGGASVNVQIKSGTNTLHGSAFEYFSHAGMRSRNYFLPADQEKTKDTKNVFGGTVGGPIKRNKVFYFVSLENTMQRAIGGPYVTQATGSASQFLSIPTAAIRSGNFTGTGVVIYDPATGNNLGQGRVPFAFANCGLTSTADPRFDSCNFIPAARINQVSKNILSHLPLPQLAGNANNYFAVPKFNTDFYKLDTKVSWNATGRTNMNGRFSYLPESELAGGLYGDEGGVNPLAVGTLLDSNISSAAVSVTHIVSPTFVIDGLFGYTRQHTYQQPPGDPNTCWGSVVGILNACQPPLQRDWAMPRVDIALPSWSSYRERHPRQRQHGLGVRLPRPAVAVCGERRLEQGGPQREVRVRPPPAAHEPLRNHRAELHLQRWRHGAQRDGRYGTDVHERLRRLSARAAVHAQHSAAEPAADRGRRRQQRAVGDAPLVGVRPLHSRPVPADAQSHGIGRRALGVLPGAAARRSRRRGLRFHHQPADDVRAREQSDRLRRQGAEGSLHATPRRRLPGRRVHGVRAGYSRNPQNDNMIGTRMRNFPVNVQINDVAVGGNNFTPVGSFSDGYNLLPILNLNQPLLEVPAGVNITTNEVGNYTRGVITTFNVTAQKVLPHSLTAQVGYVGNRQNDMVRNQNLNYSQIGGGNASLPFNQPGLAGGFRTTAQVNTARPLGRVKYDALQASMVRRMTNGLGMTGAYTYAHATDWWAGGILIPEYWGLNKGTQNGNNRHKVDISATWELPFGEGRKYASSGGAWSTILSDWQVNTYFTAFTGSPFTVTAAAASLNANSPQVADQVKPDVEITHDVGASVSWFDPTAFKPVTEARFGTAGFNTMRGPSMRTSI